jgi:hypothetical protein
MDRFQVKYRTGIISFSTRKDISAGNRTVNFSVPISIARRDGNYPFLGNRMNLFRDSARVRGQGDKFVKPIRGPSYMNRALPSCTVLFPVDMSIFYLDQDNSTTTVSFS